MDMPAPGSPRSGQTRSRTLSLIGAASGIGCAHPTAAEAPAYLRDRGIVDNLGALGNWLVPGQKYFVHGHAVRIRQGAEAALIGVHDLNGSLRRRTGIRIDTVCQVRGGQQGDGEVVAAAAVELIVDGATAADFYGAGKWV